MSTPRRYELSDYEWSIIQPLLPNKPRPGEEPLNIVWDGIMSVDVLHKTE